MSSPEKKAVIKKISQAGILPVFYHDDPEICKNVLQACYEGGIRVFEFANEGSRAQENYIMLEKYIQRTMPEMYLGIGTIKDLSTAEFFINNGADFIVSPIMDPEMGRICIERKMLWIPGCNTPTEIAMAERSGATMIKLFPCELPGPSFVRSIRPIFPNLKFIPIGAVEPSAASIIPWLEAGVAAVGLGNNLITPEMLALNDFTYLKTRIKRLLKTIQQWRKQSIL